MKSTITSILLRNAIEHVHRAQAAHSEGRVDKEIRLSIDAHLMIALAIEGIGNEVGEVVLDSWLWKRLEKSDTLLKWHIISGVRGRKPFDPGTEPMQTVRRLTSIRNHIAHPKTQDLGDEIIVRSKDGTIRRNVRRADSVEDGDFILLGLGKLSDEFNSNTSVEATKKTIMAIKMLREHLAIPGLAWIDGVEEELASGSPPNKGTEPTG
jgi:hypothetical protein